jgi:hypothetical protein
LFAFFSFRDELEKSSASVFTSSSILPQKGSRHAAQRFGYRTAQTRCAIADRCLSRHRNIDIDNAQSTDAMTHASARLASYEIIVRLSEMNRNCSHEEKPLRTEPGRARKLAKIRRSECVN